MTKRKLILILLGIILVICAVTIFVSAIWYIFILPSSVTQGSGELETAQRNTSAFKKVLIEDSMVVTLDDSTEESVSVTAESNIIDKVIVENRGETLVVKFEKQTLLNYKTIEPSKPVQVIIKYKNLEEINASGSIELQSAGRIRTDKLKINASKTPKINLDLFTNELEIRSAGSSDITLEGSTRKQIFDLNGTSKLMAKGFEAKESEIKANGTIEAELRADESLNINITGAGALTYYGSPAKINQNVNGSAQVSQGSE